MKGKGREKEEEEKQCTVIDYSYTHQKVLEWIRPDIVLNDLSSLILRYLVLTKPEKETRHLLVSSFLSFHSRRIFVCDVLSIIEGGSEGWSEGEKEGVREREKEREKERRRERRSEGVRERRSEQESEGVSEGEKEGERGGRERGVRNRRSERGRERERGVRERRSEGGRE